jgi:hypothetical protein
MIHNIQRAFRAKRVINRLLSGLRDRTSLLFLLPYCNRTSNSLQALPQRTPFCSCRKFPVRLQQKNQAKKGLFFSSITTRTQEKTTKQRHLCSGPKPPEKSGRTCPIRTFPENQDKNKKQYHPFFSYLHNRVAGSAVLHSHMTSGHELVLRHIANRVNEIVLQQRQIPLPFKKNCGCFYP